MMPDRTKWLLYARNFILTAFAAAFILSCANIARPTGGPIDTTPPVFVKSNPKPNQLNFNKNKIEIEFDEIIQVDKPTEKVIVSPAQKNMPQIQTSGRKVIVELQDSLIPNTTYTIDFSDAISDNNERNPLYNFSFSFATGNSIDTLQIGGVLLNAENLEPVTGMLVGLHSNLNDSAFTKTPMQRIAKSDAYGRFSIKNIGAGTYRIYGLNDANRDYKFDNPSEDIAFMDSTVTPTVEMVMHADTIWADSMTIDTIKMVTLPHFYPNNIILKVFNEQFKSRYLEKFERTNRNRFSLIFSAPDDSLPVLTPLNFQQEDWAIVEKNQTNDTLLYWIKDSLIYNMDTLLLTADYKRTDSLRQLTPFKDTLNLVFRERKKPVRKSKKDKKDEKIEELTDRVKRQMAEFENFRKRTEKEKAGMYAVGAKDVIEKILPVVDNFERGLDVAEDKEDPFVQGMEKIYKQFLTALDGMGVKAIEAVGNEFNPDFHNAVMHVEDETVGENIVVEEFQKGYMYKDSVVRHSMVKVAN